MDRLSFLRQSTLISVGGLLLPSALFNSCRRDSLFDDVDFDGKVIIVGAGAAGLYAGYLLNSKGIDFTILEASAVHGGRLGKNTGFADYPIDTGAQWLHGRNSIVGDLIRKKKVKITLDDSDTKFWFNSEVVDAVPRDPFIFEEDDLPDVSFKDFAAQQGFGTEYDFIIEGIAGDQGASASLLSAYWNQKCEENWVSGDEDFKFEGTYFDVFEDYIAAPILSHIQYNTAVAAIDYSQNSIQVRDAANQVRTADKVIVTVPVSILQLNEIAFEPALPASKTEAFSKMGMGPGMKVFLKFSSRFYDENVIGGPVCAAYADDTIGKVTQENVLLAFVMGDQAQALHDLGSDNAITTALLQELDLMYNGQATASFLASSVHDYTDRPFIKGAYSYCTVGMGNVHATAAAPVDGKLFFAGEAMNTNGHHQTVHGAVESAYAAVMELLTSVEK